MRTFTTPTLGSAKISNRLKRASIAQHDGICPRSDSLLASFVVSAGTDGNRRTKRMVHEIIM